MDAFYTQLSLVAVTVHTDSKGTLIALGFADAEGATRTVRPAEAVAVVDAVVASGRPVWAWDATSVAQALGDPWPSLRDARTLADALDPGAYTESLRHHPIVKGAQEALGRTVPSTSRVSWLADAIAGDGHLREAYVTAEARVVARILADLRTATSGNVEGQHAAVASVDVEARYRALAARGIRIDEAALKRAQFAMKTATVLAHRDLKADRSKDNRATRAWVASLGVKTINEFGELAVDGEGLPLLSHKHAAEVPAESAATWARYVELRNAVRTRSKLKELAGAVVDGRVHPRFSLAGGKTGRMTSSGPALFNLPKELRPMILAEEGYTFVGADLSQVEPRVVAIRSWLQTLPLVTRTRCSPAASGTSLYPRRTRAGTSPRRRCSRRSTGKGPVAWRRTSVWAWSTQLACAPASLRPGRPSRRGAESRSPPPAAANGSMHFLAARYCTLTPATRRSTTARRVAPPTCSYTAWFEELTMRSRLSASPAASTSRCTTSSPSRCRSALSRWPSRSCRST